MQQNKAKVSYNFLFISLCMLQKDHTFQKNGGGGGKKSPAKLFRLCESLKASHQGKQREESELLYMKK